MRLNRLAARKHQVGLLVNIFMGATLKSAAYPDCVT